MSKSDGVITVRLPPRDGISRSSAKLRSVAALPPTLPDVAADSARPYFLWWVDLTCGDFRKKLAQGTPDERAYWLGALLREANTRDVWLFTNVREITELWPLLYRHLGKSRDMWSYLLQLNAPDQGARVA